MLLYAVTGLIHDYTKPPYFIHFASPFIPLKPVEGKTSNLVFRMIIASPNSLMPKHL